MFFSNSQKNLVYNFTRCCSENDRPTISRVFFLSFLKTGTNLARFQLTGTSPNSQDKRNIMERGSAKYISQFFQGKNLIWPHTPVCIKLKQQVSNNFSIAWESIIPQVTVLQHWAPRIPAHPWCWRQRWRWHHSLPCLQSYLNLIKQWTNVISDPFFTTNI